jgi:fatty-acyl-CoA synthase
MAMDLSADFLQRRPTNFRPVTPIQFLRRAADVFPDRTAVIHGDVKSHERKPDTGVKQ